MSKIRIFRLGVLLFSLALLLSAFSHRAFGAFAEESTETNKVLCCATIDDIFTDNEILVILMPDSNFTPYSSRDFAEVGCIAVKELTSQIEEGKLCRIIKLTLGEKSKENVLTSISTLESRSDIYCAQPNYIESF